MIQGSGHGFVYFWVSHKAAIKVLAEDNVKTQLGKDLLCNWHGCWQNSVSRGLLDWGLWSLSSCWLVTALDSLLRKSLQHLSLISQIQQERGLPVRWKSQPYVTSSCNGRPIILSHSVGWKEVTTFSSCCRWVGGGQYIRTRIPEYGDHWRPS